MKMCNAIVSVLALASLAAAGAPANGTLHLRASQSAAADTAITASAGAAAVAKVAAHATADKKVSDAVEAVATARKAAAEARKSIENFKKASTTHAVAKEAVAAQAAAAMAKKAAVAKVNSNATSSMSSNASKSNVTHHRHHADKADAEAAQESKQKAAADALAEAAQAAKKMARAKQGDDEPISCGGVAKYKNSHPKNFEDTKKTKYVDGEHVKVEFVAGDIIPFECDRGFTTDGSKDGDVDFEAECTENGYYKPSKVCIKASKCGKVPGIDHAHATGKADGKSVQMACDKGHSLDGNKVIPGGMGTNEFFDLQCDAFSGEYKEFEGECKAYSFMPTGQIIKVYNTVFEVLFTVDCQTQLQRKFGKDGKIPEKIKAQCGKSFKESKGDCNGLVSDLKADFAKVKKAKKAHLKKSKKDWFEDDDVPGVAEESKAFCKKLWKLVELPSLIQEGLVA